jgi:cbb3-type cytochrome oxidase maturation protein
MGSFVPMGIIYLMLIVSLIIALFFLFSFIWATKSGQYDDDYTPSVRILFDDENIKTENQNKDGSTEV